MEIENSEDNLKDDDICLEFDELMDLSRELNENDTNEEFKKI